MTATMVFLHGRGQEFKDPAALIQSWRAGLAAGLVQAGMAPLADTPAVMPYYGNLLYQITAQVARDTVKLEAMPADPDEAGPFHPYLPEDTGRVERELLAGMAAAAGPAAGEEEAFGLDRLLSWRAARDTLTWIARHTRVDQAIIADHLRDVAVYLTRARSQVLDLVRAAIPADVPLVLVTHSLGTVVARDLLDDAQIRDRALLWVTAGSPLGLDAVQKNLLTKGAHNPGVSWLSAYDVHDVVALGHPLRPAWGPPLRDVAVDNGDSPHSIERYLGHREVAGPIGAAAGTARPAPRDLGETISEARMNGLGEASAQQSAGAAERVAARTGERQEKIDAITSGRLVMADEPIRIAARIDRLSHFYSSVRPVSPSALQAGEPAAVAAAGAVLERVINTPDFVDVRYLEAGTRAARAVGRVDIRDQAGRVTGFGTGSLVTPRLLLTNHHVLPDEDTAASSQIEFNFEDGVDGQPLQPRLFGLDPATFFVADEELDFALVAVQGGPEELGQFGFNPTIRAEGKAIAGDFVTIIQHPEGQKKQVALRDNRIVDVFDQFLHYAADTEPGSSGSPVFNDQWELVALHHASVPAPEHPELGKFVNEGIRISRLLKFISDRDYTGQQRVLVSDLLANGSGAASPTAPGSSPLAVRAGASLSGPGRESSAASAASVTVPLQVTITVADAGDVADVAARPQGAAGAAAVDEAVTIDPDYAGRPGYDPLFLGNGAGEVPLPALSDELVPLAAVNNRANGDPRYVLPYHHFSVVLNKERRLAFFTAVNIDGASGMRLRREADRWFFDPRVPKNQQTGEEIYKKNPLDRGHLVRRLDPAWGPSATAAKTANDDTFHFTNCTPQHHDFNAGQTLWAGLEDYILDHADNLNFRVNVFSGPVFAADDDQYRGTQLPRQFWKVVVMLKQSRDLSATAYLLSQEHLIKGLEVAPEAFSYGAYRTFQVPVRQVENLTSLSFGTLADADPLGRQEATTAAREIQRPGHIVL
jgi:endonuclease G, mitochondrial